MELNDIVCGLDSVSCDDQRASYFVLLGDFEGADAGLLLTHHNLTELNFSLSNEDLVIF